MRILFLAVAITLATGSARADQTPVTSFGANPGGLEMYEHVPANLPSGRPLVVVLHGCTQTAAAMESAGWDALADQYQFAVVYPEQESANNPVECFNWAGEYGDTTDLQRGMGENQSIMSMIDTEISTHGVARDQVYIVGFSAGGGFAAVMLAVWPDRFAAGAINSGLPYRCATSVQGAFSCQNPGVTKSAGDWGALAKMGDAGFTGPWPRVQLWQGASDTTVAPMNEDELVKQWTDVHGVDQTADSTEMIGSTTHTTYTDGTNVVVDTYKVGGMSHAVSVGTDPLGACTATAGAYFEDHAICATLREAMFFGLVGDGGGGGGGSGGSGGGGGGGGGGGSGSNGTDPGGGCSAGGASAGWLVIVAMLGMHRAVRRRMRLALPIVTVVALAGAAHAQQSPVASFGANPGGLKMYEHIPAALPSGAPLVVVLHGCTQTAASMENTGWDALADQYKFAVVYAEQESANNPVGCFNWAGEYGDPADLVRGQGENQSIMSMIDTEIATHGVDTTKVFIAGFSAGGAFVAVMVATWPERFAAASINSGLPYRCATSVSGAYSCQNPGVTKAATDWGDLARMGDSAYAGARPRLQIWHGASDTTVATMNQGELVKQWTNVFGIDADADETETIGQATRKAYKQGSTILLETYTIAGMGHAVSVGTDPLGACPGTTGPYFEDHGVCATLRQAIFFGLTASNGGMGGGTDTGPPTVSILSPSNGSTVSGSMTIVVAATDDTAVAGVDLTIDGAPAGTHPDAPYQFDWDTTAAGDGSHTILATARDAAGNTTATTITVTVDNATGGGSDGSGSSGSGGNPEHGDAKDLPACSLDAGHGPRGWLPIAAALAIALRVRRRR